MLNPILYTEKVLSDFLKYQLTTYPFTDPDLYQQMRQLLSLEHTRQTPLLAYSILKCIMSEDIL